MVLGKLPVLGLPTYLNYSMALRIFDFFSVRSIFILLNVTTKAVFSQVAKPPVKIPPLVFMSEIKEPSFTEKVKCSISFLLQIAII